MLAIHRALEAKKKAREEGEEAGFSLIELIIVVVIIGILVAIALPLFGFIQRTAVDGATESATKNAATTAVADFAQANGNEQTDADAIAAKTSSTLTLTVAGTTASDVCVSGVDTAGEKYKATAFTSGPGC